MNTSYFGDKGKVFLLFLIPHCIQLCIKRLQGKEQGRAGLHSTPARGIKLALAE